MKRVLCVLAMVLLISMLAACVGEAYAGEVDYADDYDDYADGYDYDEYDDYDEPELEPDDEIDTDISVYELAQIELAQIAAYYFSRLQAIWDADDGALWGIRLDSPIVFFCAESHIVVANRPDAEGEFERKNVGGVDVYIGTRRLFWTGSSIRHWDGQAGVAIPFQFINDPYMFIGIRGMTDDATSLLMGIIHYIMHAIQPTLMGVDGAWAPAVGNSAVAKHSYVAEVRALVNALNAESESNARLAYIHAALSYRHARRTVYNTAAAENLFIVVEGLAVYSEVMLVLNRQETMELLDTWVDIIADSDSATDAAITYGYYGGTLYGLLLDDLGVSWRHLASRDFDMGDLLMEVLGITYFLDVELP